MDVSIIIVNYNTSLLLQNCINSIVEKTVDIKYEIIVVDNDSKDESVQILEADFLTVQLIKSPVNLGFGRANNLGASTAKGKYLFLLNTDTLLINNAIKVLFDFMELENNLDIGACGGNLFNLDLTPNFSYSLKFPSLYNVFLYRSKLEFLKKNDSFNNTGDVKEVSIIIGADFFVRKELFDSIDGFDPSFFMYVEDGELCYRIKKLNYRIVSVPTAKIIHLQGKSSTNGFKLKMEYMGYLIFFKKHFSFLTLLCYKTIELFFAFLRFLVFKITMNKSKSNEYLQLIKFIINSK